jgi:hypothetical protein
LWSRQHDLELTSHYLATHSLSASIAQLQEHNPELTRQPHSFLIKKYNKLLKKAIQKVQLESQITQGSNNTPILNKLTKEELKKVV